MTDSFKEEEWCYYANCTSQNVILECSLVFILQILWGDFKPTEMGIGSFWNAQGVLMSSLNYCWLQWVELGLELRLLCVSLGLCGSHRPLHFLSLPHQHVTNSTSKLPSPAREEVKIQFALINKHCISLKIGYITHKQISLTHLSVSGRQPCKSPVQFFFFKGESGVDVVASIVAFILRH